MTRPPIAAIKAPLMLLAAAVSLTAAGILWSHREDAQARAALQREQAALGAARAKEQLAKQDARQIAQHLDAYRAMVAQGFVGEENRLAWIEAVQLANRDARLYGLSYSLSPRTAAPAGQADGLPLRQTRMTLRMALLVETDLQRFLDALRARAPGLFRVHTCRLERAVDMPFQPGGAPQLDAECELLWFTVAAGAEEAT